MNVCRPGACICDAREYEGDTDCFGNTAEDDARINETAMVSTRCPECGMLNGPYPKGDRPESSNPLQSGCPRCGWCY